MQYIKNNIKLVQKWRWILVFALILGSSFEAYSNIISNGVQLSFYELIISQIDSISTLTFYFIILIILMDIGFNKKEKVLSEKSISTFNALLYISFLCFSFIIIILLINLVASILLAGNIDLSNKPITIDNIIFQPSIAMLVSLVLFFLRFVFISSVVFIINKRCNKIAFGYLGGLAICLTDAIIYSFDFENLFVFFPLGHSYLEPALRYSSSILTDIIIDILYYAALIAVVYFVIFLFNRSDKNRDRGVFIETNHMQ